MIPLKKSYKAFAYRFYSHFTQHCKGQMSFESVGDLPLEGIFPLNTGKIGLEGHLPFDQGGNAQMDCYLTVGIF